MPQQSSEFTQYMVADETGTLQDISQYVRDAQLPMASMDADHTTFATSGAAVAETHRRGAVQANVTLNCVYDPAFIDQMARIVGKRDGTQLQARFGANAAPTVGDSLFYGTFTLLGINFTYSVHAEAMVALNFRPTDGGALAPKWDKV